MKTSLLLHFATSAIICGAASSAKDCADPLTGLATCDLRPVHCNPPVCGKNSKGVEKWFGNRCYLAYYNWKCHTDYVRTSDRECDSGSRPPIADSEERERPCTQPNQVEAGWNDWDDDDWSGGYGYEWGK